MGGRVCLDRPPEFKEKLGRSIAPESNSVDYHLTCH